jgi:hypothetical protein
LRPRFLSSWTNITDVVLLPIRLVLRFFGFIFITDLWDSLIEVYHDADRCLKRRQVQGQKMQSTLRKLLSHGAQSSGSYSRRRQ